MTPGLDADADAVVLGAGGTGKTTLAVDLVLRAIDDGVDPGSVLLLAPNRLAAASLRDRIAARIQVPTPGPLARTPQSLAHGIVTRRAIRDRRPAPRYVSGADHDRIIAALLAEEIERGEDAYWPLGREVRSLAGFRAELREVIARAAERGMRGADLAALGREHGRADWVAVAAFTAKLAERIEREYTGFTPLDSTYVLRRAADLARAGDESAAGLALLVVDDAQELGYGAVELVAALGSRGARVVVFGDPDLSVGGFRGALPGAFLSGGFWQRIGRPRPAPTVLDLAWRHGAAIRDVVRRATEPIGTAGAGPQRAARAGGGEGRAAAFTVAESGALSAFIARTLRERAVAGMPWSSMAVVVRGGDAVPRIARELRGLEVPAAGAGVAEVGRDDWAVRSIVAVAGVAVDAARSGEVALAPALAEELLGGSIGRLDALSIRRIRAALRRAALEGDPEDPRRSGELLAAALAVPGGFAMLDRSPEGRGAQRVAAALHGAVRVAAGGGSIEELLWAIWSGSGLERLWGEAALGSGALADEANRHLDSVLALFAAAKRFVEQDPEARAEPFLAAWTGASLEEDSLAARTAGDAVFVGTPAALIGKAFDLVLIAELQDGVWPNPRVRGSLLGAVDLGDLADGRDPGTIDRRREVLHDELRLLASAIARARTEVIAVAVDGEETSPSSFLRVFGESVEPAGEDAVAPLTLRGLVGRLRRELGRSGDPAAASALARLAAEGVPGASPGRWYGLGAPTTSEPLAEEGEPVEVHPSSFGTYEECPLHWALRRLGGDASTAEASLGTIVHDAADAIADPSVPADAAAILDRIRERWADLEFESEWIREKEWLRAEAIAERLAGYQRDLLASGGGTLVSETRLRLELGRAVLQGRIDRVERVVEGDVERAVVVDFKTGRETRYETERQLVEHPQLAAYQLALREGAIDGLQLPPGVEPGGARLVILTPVPGKKDVRPQPVLDDAQAAEWKARVEDAAEGMVGPTYLAYVDRHCSSRNGGLCPIHVIEAVSA